jgi:hypothetical protein
MPIVFGDQKVAKNLSMDVARTPSSSSLPAPPDKADLPKPKHFSFQVPAVKESAPIMATASGNGATTAAAAASTPDLKKKGGKKRDPMTPSSFLN